jgi:hypothetical protein
MDTTVPKVPPQAAAASEAARTVFQQYDFNITIHSKKPSDFQLFKINSTHYVRAAPRSFSNDTKSLPCARNRARGRGAPGSLFPDAPPDEPRLPYYSALFLRRRTISPKNRTASTAQTMRIIELSIIAFLLPAKMTSLHVIHHGE